MGQEEKEQDGEGNRPLSATNGTRTSVFLLFFHFPQYRILFDLDKISAFLLTQAQPEILDTLPLFSCARAPYLICIRFALLSRCWA